MVQFSIVVGGSLPVLESAMAGAARFAEAVRSVPNARAVSAQAGSFSVANDRQHVAASGRITAEANARSAAVQNATAAVSLLQTVDDALAEMSIRLSRMDELATEAGASGLSDQERAQLDSEFQTLKEEIDTIAANTSFNGITLLQGDGAGGALEISFKVGSDGNDGDTITLSIAPASVADLSSDLDNGDIQTLSGAETAVDSVAAAQDAVDAIRAGISGDVQRFYSAIRGNESIAAGLDDAKTSLVNPTVSVDMAQLLAERVAEEGGIRLTDHAVERIQQLLIGLELPDASKKEQGVAAPASDDARDPVSRSNDFGSISDEV